MLIGTLDAAFIGELCRAICGTLAGVLRGAMLADVAAFDCIPAGRFDGKTGGVPTGVPLEVAPATAG